MYDMTHFEIDGKILSFGLAAVIIFGPNLDQCLWFNKKYTVNMLTFICLHVRLMLLCLKGPLNKQNL